MAGKVKRAEKQARQGDVLLTKVRANRSTKDNMTLAEKDKMTYVLAEGEVTGHAHRVAAGCTSLFVGEQARLLEVQKVVPLRHEEHETIEFPMGDWEVRTKREYSPRGNFDLLD